MATVSEAITALIDAIHDPTRFAIGGEIHGLVDAAKAEERERIERMGEVFNGTNFDSTRRWFMIPASAFEPKEAENENQKD